MLGVFPNEDTTALTVLRYERARRLLSPDDWDGRARLVRTLKEEGMTQLAQREAEVVLRNDPENEEATAILREYAEADLQNVDELFRQREFLVARDLALRFTQTNTRFEDLVERARETYNRADIEAQRQIQDNRRRAQEIAERGIQYLNTAYSFADSMTRTDVNPATRPFSYKQEAAKNARRAIDNFETALRIDPSLGGMQGMDLNNRLSDARQLYNRLTDRPGPLRGPRRIIVD